MLKASLVYLAAVRTEEPAARCCRDVPEGFRQTRERPGAARRWASKIRSGVPASLRVFRRTLALPTGSSTIVGSAVVTRSGSHVGRVEDVVIGVASGHARYAVASGSAAAEVILLPDRAVRPAGRRDVVIVDERALDAPTRQALLAG